MNVLAEFTNVSMERLIAEIQLDLTRAPANLATVETGGVTAYQMVSGKNKKEKERNFHYLSV